MHKINYKIILLITVVLLGGFLRFYQLNKHPLQLNHDEISQLYEAISVTETGKDIYGNYLPVVFRLFDVYAPGHYIYLTTIFYKIFGGEEVIIRMPAALLGTLTIFSVYMFVNILFGSWKLALISAFFMAISPSEVFYSRKSFEYMIGHFFVFLGLSFLLIYLKERNGRLWALLGGTTLAIAMYTYTAHATTVPLLFISYLIIFRKKLFPNKKYLAPLAIFSLFIIPLAYLIFSNSNMSLRARNVFITQDVVLASLTQGDPTNINLLVTYALNRFLYQFNPLYIFGNGLDFTNQTDLGIGPLYFFQIPFFFLGLIILIKSSLSIDKKSFFAALIILSMIPGSLTFESHSPHRSVMAFALLTIVAALGFYWFIQFINKVFKQKIFVRYLVFICVVAAIVWNFVYFVHMYIVNFPYEKSQYMHYPYKEVALYAWSNYDKFDRIIIDPIYGETAPIRAVGAHYYFAYYGKYPPAKFQKDLKIDKSGISFDKFYIREIDWEKDKLLKNSLIISNPWRVSATYIDPSKILRTFKFYDGRIAFYAIKI